MKRCIYVYPWDFVDEGVDNVLEAVRSKGVTGIAIAVGYHTGKFILPRNPKRRVYFPEDGVVYFPANAKYYKNTPMKPLRASLAAGRDLLSEILERCRDFDLEPEAWLVCLHNTRLGMEHPELTARNAYGDRYPYSLCPARSEVAEYAMGLIKDLVENYPLRRVFLESLSYMGFCHGYHHEFFGVELNRCQESLLGLCFCDACKSEAARLGLDTARIVGVVRGSIAPAFEEDTPDQNRNEDDGAWGQFLDLLQKHPELAAFMDMRCEIVRKLVSEARGIADKNNVEMDFFGPVFTPSCSQAIVEGISIEGIADLVDHYVVPVSHAGLSVVERDVEFVKERIEPGKIVLSLRMAQDSMPSKTNFMGKVALVRKHRLHGCNLYNYGTIPSQRLEWIGELE